MNKSQEKSFILKDGTEIILTSNARNHTGYLGVSFSPAWTLNYDFPFIAYGNRNIEEASLLKCKGGNSWHGGYYSDAREAAYVVALYKENPIETDEIVYANGGVYIDFPSDIYNLPVFLNNEEVKKQIDAYKIANPKVAKSRPHVKTKKDVKVNSVWKDICEKYNIPELAKQLGRDVIINARNSFTVSEFEAKFNS